MYKSEYYGPVSETYCHSHNTDITMQSNQPTVNGMSYWNQHASSQQQQHQQHQSSPNHHLNYGSGAAYGNQHTEPIYHAFQPNNQNVYQSNQNFNTNTAANGNTTNNNGNNVSSQDIYQYSPYSGDLLQPEDIFQMDQPIRSANVSSLNGMSASPPATLLDLGSGTIEQKSISYSQSELSDSYYSLNDDNSTASSHTADPGNCFYANLSDTMHLHNNDVVANGSSQNTNNSSGGSSNNNNNNNNTNMISMNVMNVSTTSPNVAHSFEHAATAATTTTATSMAVAATHAAYYCDTRTTDSADVLARQYVKHSPSESSAACDRIVNVNYQAACYVNNNNNNNNATTVNNNIHENFKTQKRKANEAFGPVQDNQFNAFGANLINHQHHHQHEYYHSSNVEQHLSSNLNNLELHRDNGNLQQTSPYANAANCSPILSEYCNDPVLSNSHGNQCLTYYDSETNNLVQLSTNSYEISVVSSN